VNVLDIEKQLKGIPGTPVQNVEQIFDSTTTRALFPFSDLYAVPLELTDNSIAAGAKEIYILLNLSEDIFVHADYGGTGMDENILRNRYFHWGALEPKNIVRYYGVGGKTAVGELCNEAHMWCTPQTLEATWRVDMLSFKEATISGKLQFPPCHKFPCQSPVSSIVIKMTKLRMKLDIRELEKEISNRYAFCLNSGGVKIFIGKTEDSYKQIKGSKLPIEEPKKIDIRWDGKYITGELGLKKLGSRVRSGIRCYSGEMKRLIEEREFFGLDKNPNIDVSLLLGGIDNNFVPVTGHKESFDKASSEYKELYDIMSEELKPYAELLKRDLEVSAELGGIRLEVENLFNDLIGGTRSWGQGEDIDKIHVHRKSYVKTGRKNESETPASAEDKGVRKRKGHIYLEYEANADSTKRSRIEKIGDDKDDKGELYRVYVNSEYPMLINTYSKSGEVASATKDYIIDTMASEYYATFYKNGVSEEINKYKDNINTVLAKIKPGRENILAARINKIVRLRRQGLSSKKIQDELKCSWKTIDKVFKVYPELRKRRSIIPEKDRKSIIRHKVQGWSWKKLIEHYPYSGNPIWRVLREAGLTRGNKQGV